MSMRLLLAAVVILLTAAAVRAEEGWKSLFDGKNLTGWEVKGGHAPFHVEDGMIVGQSAEKTQNTFLCYGNFADFELEFDVLCDKQLNSGVQIRSHVYEKPTPQLSDQRIRNPGTVYGYQAEIGLAKSGNNGNFWDEARRCKFLDDSFASRPKARTAFNDNEWNHYCIVAQGDHIRSWVNGIPCADFHDTMDASGFIGLQVHMIKPGTGPYHVRFKNLRIRELNPDDQVK